MSGRVSDDALSEVIGFILIIAIIVILGSLYMTYVVPSEGRDAEIQHMQEIEKFFTDFKMNMDSLWLNDQIGVAFNEILQLGTGGQTSSGSFSIFPVMQPVSSTGLVEISNYPKLQYTIEGDFTSNTIVESGDIALSETQINAKKTPLYVDFHTNIDPWELPPYSPYSLNIWSIQDEPFSAILEVRNITLRPEDLLDVMEWNINPDTEAVYNLRIHSTPTVELVLSVAKNGTKIIDNQVISRQSIRNEIWTEIQRIDLLDEAYGLNDDIEYPFGLNYQYFEADGSQIVLENPFLLEIEPSLTVTSDTIDAGSLCYSAKNPYWINQEYIYKLGKVFLKQGGVVEPKIDYPWISVTSKTGIEKGADYIMNIEITPITIQGDGSVAGSDTVQLSSQITSIQHTISETSGGTEYSYTPAEINPNVKDFTLTITESDPQNADYWRREFTSMLSKVHENDGTWWKVNDPTPSDPNVTVIEFLGESGETGEDYNDIFLKYKQVNSKMSITAPLNVG